MKKILEFTRKNLIPINLILIAVEIYKNIAWWIPPIAPDEGSLARIFYDIYIFPQNPITFIGGIVLFFLVGGMFAFEHVNYQELVNEDKRKKFLIYTNVMMAESWITLIPYILMIFMVFIVSV